MTNVAGRYSMTQQCIGNASTLDTVLQQYTTITYVGVQFDDSLAGRTDLDKNIRVTLR